MSALEKQNKPLGSSWARWVHVPRPPATFIIRMILSGVAVFLGKRKMNLRLDVFSLCDLFHKCFCAES